MFMPMKHRVVTKKERVITPKGERWASPGEIVRSDDSGNNWILPPETAVKAAKGQDDPEPDKAPGGGQDGQEEGVEDVGDADETEDGKGEDE